MITIIGPGSIGGYVAWQLSALGHPLELAARTPFDQLVVEAGGVEHRVGAPVLTDPTQARAADWVILATKAHHTDAAAPWLRAACGPATNAVVVMQNGVEHRERVAPYIGSVPIVPCVVNCAAEAVAPGRVVHHAFASFDLEAGPAADGVVALFAGSAASVQEVPDFTTVAWRKLISNITVSPITALTQRRMEVMGNPAAQELGVALADECVAVANAAGARLDPAIAAQSVAGSASRAGAAFGSSMLYDRLAGRETEHEALTGAVVRAGERYGIPTPYNRAVLGLLRSLR